MSKTKSSHRVDYEVRDSAHKALDKMFVNPNRDGDKLLHTSYAVFSFCEYEDGIASANSIIDSNMEKVAEAMDSPEKMRGALADGTLNAAIASALLTIIGAKDAGERSVDLYNVMMSAENVLDFLKVFEA